MNVQSSCSMMAASAFEARKALILRHGSLPDAPLAMQRQIIERRHAKGVFSATAVMNRLLCAVRLGGFGHAAGGR